MEVNYDYLIEDFSYCSFYEYRIEESTALENEILMNFKDSLLSAGFFTEDNGSVQIYSIINMAWSDSDYSFIFYSVNLEDNKEFNFKGFQNLNDPKLENIRNVLRLQNDVFWYFYNNEPDSVFQELNTIRVSVNDENGNLNIFELASFIGDNENIFNEYFID
ncbi:hypothetical protein [Marivirga sp.]|uniref:hypothetical protein n=1 Tax=Marivirga sp. TaxID=2018662 RepID=UPI002D7E3323|nr:hypothetical protein [Marivirga sp.]HET8858953.1 hypothetical protein [Marivirga sp.]